MSSHHIVREKQEPALLILGLDHFSDELLGQLLEWSPTVITTDALAETLHVLGIKIDVLLTNGITDNQQADVKLVELINDDALQTALNYLTANGYAAVNIIADELALPDYDQLARQLDLVIYYKEKKISAVRSGFSKWKAAGESVEILTRPHNFQYTGLLPVTDTFFNGMVIFFLIYLPGLIYTVPA